MRNPALILCCAMAISARVEATPAQLIVAGKTGLVVVDANGKPAKTLSKTPGSHPRWTRDHKAVVFFTAKHEIRRVQLDTGVETVVTTMPAKVEACPGTTIDITALKLMIDSDFALDESGSLCVALYGQVPGHDVDRGVSWLVDLASGHATQTVLASHCDEERTTGSAMAVQGCTGKLEDAAAQDAIKKPFDVKKGAIVDHGNATTKLAPEIYRQETSSPSGRWVVIAGRKAKDDSHRDLFLFDRDSGALYPMPATAATWPAAIATAELGKLDTWTKRTINVEGASTIAWIDDNDTLLIDHTFITPGTRIVQLPGDLVR